MVASLLTYGRQMTTRRRMKKLCFGLIVVIAGIVILAIVISRYSGSTEMQAVSDWVGFQPWPTPNQIEIEVSELMERCLESQAVPRNSAGLHEARQCLKRAASQLVQLKLERLLRPQNETFWNQTKALYPLSVERETARRRVESTSREVFNFVNAQLDSLTATKFSTQDSQKGFINSVKKTLEDYKRALTNDLHSLRHVDQDEEWRVNESRQLGQLVQRRLHSLQNPENCSEAKLVVCNLGRPHGFSSLLHEATMCLLGAYASRRTLILTTNGWAFAPSTWDTFLMPVSGTCTPADTKDMDPRNQTPSARVVSFGSLNGWSSSRPKYFPRAIPADLVKRLKAFHGDPFAWWVGQLVSYLLRPKPHLEQMIQAQAEKMGFQSAVAGIHVRRTDKVNDEAQFHGLEEYMQHVQEYYDTREQRERIKERRVFVATDDPSAFTELQKKFPDYNFTRVESSTNSVSVKSRYSPDGLSAILVDLHLLSMCDFVVCTYSSNIGRAVYELMQTSHSDASLNVYSLDSSVYHLTFSDNHYKRAILKHAPTSAAEIELLVGDLVLIQPYYFQQHQLLVGNLRNGSTIGVNKRTGQKGLFASYKVVDEIDEIYETS